MLTPQTVVCILLLLPWLNLHRILQTALSDFPREREGVWNTGKMKWKIVNNLDIIFHFFKESFILNNMRYYVHGIHVICHVRISII